MDCVAMVTKGEFGLKSILRATFEKKLKFLEKFTFRGFFRKEPLGAY